MPTVGKGSITQLLFLLLAVGSLNSCLAQHNQHEPGTAAHEGCNLGMKGDQGWKGVGCSALGKEAASFLLHP